MVCLDTDFLVALLRGAPEAGAVAGDLDRTKTRKSTTPINAFELLLGAHMSQHREENVRLVKELLGDLDLLELDLESCENAAVISSNLRSDGHMIGIQDTLIAGITMRHNETLVTRNTQHFRRVQDLTIRTW